jgi:hypothetical protein
MDQAIMDAAEEDSRLDDLSPDERDHEACYVSRYTERTTHRDCEGDGWYNCVDCARYLARKEPTDG